MAAGDRSLFLAQTILNTGKNTGVLSLCGVGAFATTRLAAMQAEMNRLAQQLPEYRTVQAMYGVGETTAVHKFYLSDVLDLCGRVSGCHSATIGELSFN